MTTLNNLIDTELIGQFLDVKLIDAIKLSPLVGIDRTLEGRPGSTLTLPKFAYIGSADDVAEGEAMTPVALSESTVTVKVKKAGKGVEVTDEAVLSAYGDTVNEIGRQLLMSIAGKVDNDCAEAFRKATLNVTAASFDKYVISDMIAKFGEDLEEDMTVLINPAHLATLRRDKDFVEVNDGMVIMNGEVGRLFGCRIVISNKVKATEAFLVKAGAVKILMKRNVMVEADRNIVNKTNTYVVDEHYVAYLEDESKIVKAKIGA